MDSIDSSKARLEMLRMHIESSDYNVPCGRYGSGVTSRMPYIASKTGVVALENEIRCLTQRKETE